MTSHDDLLVQLARAVASAPVGHALSERLCLACRDLAGADAAALTVAYADAHRVTLHATDSLAGRLEDLQDVLGQGPGVTSAETAEIQVCAVREAGASRWPQFATAALDLVGGAVVHAVPMRPDGDVLGVLTLYVAERDQPAPLALPDDTLLRLAAATAAALVRDPTATTDEVERGPWRSRVRVHQATGMVVAQLRLAPDDALAVLKAHAYAGDTTLADVADRVLDRTLRFHPPREEGR